MNRLNIITTMQGIQRDRTAVAGSCSPDVLACEVKYLGNLFNTTLRAPLTVYSGGQGPLLDWNIVVRTLPFQEETPFDNAKNESNLILISREANVADPDPFVHPNARTVWDSMNLGARTRFQSDSVALYPFHRIAIPMGDYWFEQGAPFYRKLLKQEGYTLSQKKPLSLEGTVVDQVTGSQQYALSESHEQEIVRMQRVYKRVPSLDERAQNIIHTLLKHLPDALQCTFTFGTYRTSVKSTTTADREYVDFEEIITKSDGVLWNLHGKGLSQGGLENKMRGLAPTRALNLISTVARGQDQFQLPLLDFTQNPRSPANLLKGLKISGMLVASGNSYHFYGLELLTQDEWNAFMNENRSRRGVDTNFMDINAKMGKSYLRLSASSHKLSQPALVGVYDAASGKLTRY